MDSGGDFRQTSTEGKRKHGSDTDEEPTRKRTHATVVAPEARSIDFRQIQNPKRDYDCFIQVDQSQAYGSLASVIDGHGVKVFIDPGRSANPYIGIRFRYPGSDGYQVAKMDWEIGAKVGGQWVVEEFNYVLVKDVPQDIAINNRDVLRACPEAVLPRLMCMTLVVTGQGQGYKRKDIGVASEPFKACLETIINSRKRITLRIWFLVPIQFPGIDKKCLSVIRYLLGQRKEPFSGVSDANSVYLTELPETSKRGGKARNTTEALKPLNMGFGDMSAVGQDAMAAQPTVATDWTRTEHSWDPHANIPVRRFGYDPPADLNKAVGKPMKVEVEEGESMRGVREGGIEEEDESEGELEEEEDIEDGKEDKEEYPNLNDIKEDDEGLEVQLKEVEFTPASQSKWKKDEWVSSMFAPFPTRSKRSRHGW